MRWECESFFSTPPLFLNKVRYSSHQGMGRSDVSVLGIGFVVDFSEDVECLWARWFVWLLCRVEHRCTRHDFPFRARFEHFFTYVIWPKSLTFFVFRFSYHFPFF